MDGASLSLCFSSSSLLCFATSCKAALVQHQLIWNDKHHLCAVHTCQFGAGFAKAQQSQNRTAYVVVTPCQRRRGEMVFYLRCGAEVWSAEVCMSGLAHKDGCSWKWSNGEWHVTWIWTSWSQVSLSVLKFRAVLAAALQGLECSFSHKAEQRWSLAHAQICVYSLISYQSNNDNFSLLCNATPVVACVCWGVFALFLTWDYSFGALCMCSPS